MNFKPDKMNPEDYLSREANGRDEMSVNGFEKNDRLIYTTPRYKWSSLANVILKSKSSKVLNGLIERVKTEHEARSEDARLKQQLT